MVFAGGIATVLARHLADTNSFAVGDLLGPALIGVSLVAMFVVVHGNLPEWASLTRLWAARIEGLFAVGGVIGFGVGSIYEYRQHGQLRNTWQSVGLLELLILSNIAGVIFLNLRMFRSDRAPRSRFFLFDRSHISNKFARRALIAGACHALLVALAVGLVLQSPSEPGHFPRLLWRAGIAYFVGIALSLVERYPQRALGFVPIAAIFAAVGLLIAWIAPGAVWPILLLGGSLGLAHTPPRIELLANLAPRQRIAGLALLVAAQAMGALAGMAMIRYASPIHMTAAIGAILLAVAAVCLFLRELIEIVVEPVLAIAYTIRPYGPGAKTTPTRGPILVIANHTTWLDPLWVAKLMPLRVRPLMTSRFYDLPLISWLMRNVFHTIRVVDSGFRREVPEIQQAIAALEHGENVLIFPEGWLKRREEQSVRRFGQGVYQILREKPRTPVIACWIEGGWGSYTSFWNGPPSKNKKMDFFRRIRIGISSPQVLSLEVLSDQIHTRRHLMQACLHARTYLGLPELPLPPFGVDGDSDEDKD